MSEEETKKIEASLSDDDGEDVQVFQFKKQTGAKKKKKKPKAQVKDESDEEAELNK